jgi:hypothetical protein
MIDFGYASFPYAGITFQIQWSTFNPVNHIFTCKQGYPTYLDKPALEI